MRLSEIAAALDAERIAREQRRAQADGDRYARFYRSKGWQACRYKFLASLKPEQRRCAACGATARDERPVVDHVMPIRTAEGWERRLTGPFQLLCNTDNRAKGSHDQTNFNQEQTNHMMTQEQRRARYHRNLDTLTAVHLIDLDTGREIWPPPQPSMAAAFAAIAMPSYDRRFTADWAQDDEQRAAAQRAEQQRMADYYARTTREQEERDNREARERFAESQRKRYGDS
jgi:hypothetical protein